MAKQVGIIQFNGALGETIGAPSIKGYQVIKKRPVAVHNPNTIKQRTQRTFFAAATATSSGTPLAALAGMRPFAKTKKCSVRNAFSKILLDDKVFNVNMVVPGESITTVQYPHVTFSKGAEPIPAFGVLDFDTPQQVAATVTLPQGINTKACNIIAVVFCPDAQEYAVQTFPCNVDRNDITSIIIDNIPSRWNGMKVHAWAYLQNLIDENNVKAYYDAKMYEATVDVQILETQAKYSNTIYLGTGNIG